MGAALIHLSFDNPEGIRVDERQAMDSPHRVKEVRLKVSVDDPDYGGTTVQYSSVL